MAGDLWKIALAAMLTIPAVACRLGGVSLRPVAAVFIFGTGLAAASFSLAWAARVIGEHIRSTRVATLALVLFGRYHPKAPSAVAQLSKVWLSHWKYSVTILALTVAGLSGGRLKATFDAMTPAQHLEAARADGKAMPSSARDHLAAIPSSAPEYQEAQKLLAELAPATKRQQEIGRAHV